MAVQLKKRFSGKNALSIVENMTTSEILQILVELHMQIKSEFRKSMFEIVGKSIKKFKESILIENMKSSLKISPKISKKDKRVESNIIQSAFRDKMLKVEKLHLLAVINRISSINQVESVMPDSTQEIDPNSFNAILLTIGGKRFCHGFKMANRLIINFHSWNMLKNNSAIVTLHYLSNSKVSSPVATYEKLYESEVLRLSDLSTKAIDLVAVTINKGPFNSWKDSKFHFKEKISFDPQCRLICLKYGVDESSGCVVPKMTIGNYHSDEKHTCSTTPGDSGAFLIDNRSKVIGIHTGTTGDFNYFIPTRQVDWSEILRKPQCLNLVRPDVWLDKMSLGCVSVPIVDYSDDFCKGFKESSTFVVGSIRNFKPDTKTQTGDPFLMSCFTEREKEIFVSMQKTWRVAMHSRDAAVVGINKYFQLPDRKIDDETLLCLKRACSIIRAHFKDFISPSEFVDHQQALMELEGSTACGFPNNCESAKTKRDFIDHFPEVILDEGHLVKLFLDFCLNRFGPAVSDSNSKVEMRLRTKTVRQINSFSMSWLYIGYRIFLNFTRKFYCNWHHLNHVLGARFSACLPKIANSFEKSGGSYISWDQSSQDANMVDEVISLVDDLICDVAQFSKKDAEIARSYMYAEASCFVVANGSVIRTLDGNKSGGILTIIRNVFHSLLCSCFLKLSSGATEEEVLFELRTQVDYAYGDDFISRSKILTSLSIDFLMEQASKMKVILTDVVVSEDISDLSFCSNKFLKLPDSDTWVICPEDPEKLFGHLSLMTVKTPLESYQRVRAVRDLFYAHDSWWNFYDIVLISYRKRFDTNSPGWQAEIKGTLLREAVRNRSLGNECCSSCVSDEQMKSSFAQFREKTLKKTPNVPQAEIQRRWDQKNNTKKVQKSPKNGESTQVSQNSGITLPSKAMRKRNGPQAFGSGEAEFVSQVLDPFSAASSNQVSKGPCVVNLPTNTMSFNYTANITTDLLGNFICSACADLSRAMAMNTNPANLPGFTPGGLGPGSWIETQNFAPVPKVSDFQDLYSNARVVGMGMSFTPTTNALQLQGRLVGFGLPDDVTFPVTGPGITWDRLQTLAGAVVGTATEKMTLSSRPLDYRAFEFHVTRLKRLDPLPLDRYAAMPSALALTLYELQQSGTITPGQLDALFDSVQDQGWLQLYLCGSGLAPNTVVGTVSYVYLVEAIPFERSFSTGQATLGTSMPNDLTPQAKTILAKVPVAIPHTSGSSFTERLTEAVTSVQEATGNLGVPFLPQALGAVKGVLGLFKKRR